MTTEFFECHFHFFERFALVAWTGFRLEWPISALTRSHVIRQGGNVTTPAMVLVKGVVTSLQSPLRPRAL